LISSSSGGRRQLSGIPPSVSDFFSTRESTIVRTGGATDGTTPISWKVITANSTYSVPFQCPPIAIWNDTGTGQTATIECIWGGGAVPWIRNMGRSILIGCRLAASLVRK
jgi:hypothetical protein